MTGSRRDAAVFLVHYFDREIERRFDRLQAECAQRCDVFVLAEKGTPVPERLKSEARFFEFARIRRMARSIIGDRVVPGNAHLRAIDFYRREPGYRHYWFIEYDVVYTGRWDALMASLDDDDADLIASCVRDPEEDPRWHWIRTFDSGPDTVPADRRVVAFLPIFRISAAGLAAVDERVASGWTGHFEALLPTALAFRGMTISDFGGSGPFTPEARRHRVYLDGEGLYGTGTLRFHPPVRWPMIPDMLHHPCKTRPGRLRPGVTKAIVSDRLRRPHLYAAYLARLLRGIVSARQERRASGPDAIAR